MGDEGAAAVEALLKNVNRPAQGIVATVVGVVALLVGAMSVFGELQNALDRIWRAPTPPGGSGLLQLLRARLLSFGMVFGIGFLVLVSLLLSAALAALGKWWAPMFGGWSVLASAVDLVLGFAVVTRRLRDDLQGRAAGPHRVARRLDRRGGDRACCSRSAASRSASTSAARRSRRGSAPPPRSSCCWSGCTTRRRSSCSAPSSPGSMRTRSDRGARRTAPPARRRRRAASTAEAVQALAASRAALGCGAVGPEGEAAVKKAAKVSETPATQLPAPPRRRASPSTSTTTSSTAAPPSRRASSASPSTRSSRRW